MNTALLIIDVQNDYFPKGKMELHNSIDASFNIKDLLKYFRKQSMPIIHIQHISLRAGSTFFIPNTNGVEFHENVKPEDGEKTITKHFPNSFRDTELDNYLKENKISKLIIVGMMTHMCIDSTVRRAFDLGYECYVISDCCATKSLMINDIVISADNGQYSFLASLNGTFAKVLSKEEIINQLT